MVFTIMLGSRSRKLEEKSKDFNSWERNALIYSKILGALLEGFGTELSPEEWSYIDCSLEKRSNHSDGHPSIMQPSQKFNEQLRVWFTTQDCVTDKVVPNLDEDRRKELEKELQEAYGSKKVIYGACDSNSWFINGAFSHRQTLWKKYPGCLGQYSGVNPLVTAIKYILRATQIAIAKDNSISSKNLSEIKNEADSSECLIQTPTFCLPGLDLFSSSGNNTNSSTRNNTNTNNANSDAKNDFRAI